MNEQDRFKEITKIAADVSQKLVNVSLRAAENNMYFEDIEMLIYQLGYIEGLSYIPKENNGK